MILLKLSGFLNKLPITNAAILLFTLVSWNGLAQNNITLNTSYSIPAGTVLEVNDLYLNSNAKLYIEGTLIVRGSISMANNSPEFRMGNNARVIVYGNFAASNRMQISVSSYLIIYGNFTKDGSSNQGDLTINNGNIYIFGDVDPNWTDLQTCSTYGGNTTNEQSTCDYGKINEFEKNFNSLPADLQQNVRCFPVSNITNKIVCSGNATEFTINAISNVSYQWQVKTTNNPDWTNTGTNSFRLNIPSTTASMNGNQYRVVVKPINPTTTTCKIAISNTATLTVTPGLGTIGSISGPAEICSETENITYSIPVTNGAQSYSWTFPSGWTVISGSNTNLIHVRAGTGASSGTIQAQVTGTCDTKLATLEVKVLSSGQWTGNISNNWNNPSNWSCNLLPTLETNVLIPANVASGNYPLVSTGNNALAKNLIIENGARITVTENWLRIAGVVENSGSLNAMNGSVSFEGTTAQTIPSAIIANNRIENLQINNTSGVTSEGVIEVTGILKVTNGTFTTNNLLRLISSAEKTALIDGSGMGEVSGTVGMQRYLDPAYGYKYFSSPFAETKAEDFNDIDLSSGFPNFYRYDENRSLMLGEDRNDATGWEAITDPAAALNILEGYALNFGENSSATVVELSGLVNNGSYTRTLENNNREYTRGFHLTGNPYPSPIDWDTTEGWEKTNIENGIYFFTAGETQYTGTYTSYINGISSTDGNSSNIIPSMQGFFVKVTNPEEGISKVTGTLTVTNKARVNDFEQDFLKTREREEKPLLRLTAAYEGAGNKDAMVIYFVENSGIKFSKEMDAHKLMNTDAAVPNLYSVSKDKINSSIKALPFPGSGSYEKILLGILAARTGRMNINLADLQNIPRNWNIYLIDKERRTGQDLRKNPSYSFSIKEGEHHDRFQLMFSQEKITDPAIAFDENFSVDSREFLKVKLNLEEDQVGELRVSTVTGQLLEIKEGRGKEQVEFRSINSSGIYFINLYVNGRRYSKKILLNK